MLWLLSTKDKCITENVSTNNYKESAVLTEKLKYSSLKRWTQQEAQVIQIIKYRYIDADR